MLIELGGHSSNKPSAQCIYILKMIVELVDLLVGHP